MEKKITDSLHLYLGCDMCRFPMKAVNSGWLKNKLKDNPNFDYKYTLTLQDIIRDKGTGLPILRPLSESDMSEEEKKESSTVWFNAVEKFGNGILAYAEVVNWYRSKYIDVDGLIDAGLAINKQSL